MADWLDDADPTDPAYDKEVWNRDLQKMSEKHKNAGFKEVLSDTKDMTLQTGFRDGALAGRAWGELNGLLTALRDSPASVVQLNDAQRSALVALVAELDILRAKRDFPSFAQAPQAAPLVAAAAAAVGRPDPVAAATTPSDGGKPEACCGGGDCATGDSAAAGDGGGGGCCRSACADEPDLWQRCMAFLHDAKLSALVADLPKHRTL